MRWHKKDRNGYEKHAGLWLWIVWITLERELWNPHTDLGGQYAAWSVLLRPPTSLKKRTSVRLHTHTHRHTHILLSFFFMKQNSAELMEPGLLWVDTLELCSGLNLRLERSPFSKINSNKTWRGGKKKGETAVRTDWREEQPFLPRQPRLLCFLTMQFVKCWRCCHGPEISTVFFLLGVCTKVTRLGLGKDHEWRLLR